MASAPDLLPPGTRLTRDYVLREPLGYGGMSRVYRAEFVPTGEVVAVKLLDASLSADPKVVDRFLREVQTSSEVRHENIVEIVDLGEADDGRPFMAMELLEGEDLGVTLRREGALPWARAKPMLLQVLAALEAAHAHSVIHRDIKPENIFRVSRRGNDDFLKVFDFGIAKVLYAAGSDSPQPLTADGVVLGTPEYMSPEQCLCQPIDARSDLYAVGVLAYEMLTGRAPFRAPEAANVMFQHIYEPVPPMREAAPTLAVDPKVEAVVQRALEKRPDARFPSAERLAEAIQAERLPSVGVLSRLRALFERGG